MCFLLHVTPPVPQAKMLFFMYLSLAWITFSHNTFFGLDTVREKNLEPTLCGLSLAF